MAWINLQPWCESVADKSSLVTAYSNKQANGFQSSELLTAVNSNASIRLASLIACGIINKLAGVNGFETAMSSGTSLSDFTTALDNTILAINKSSLESTISGHTSSISTLQSQMSSLNLTSEGFENLNNGSHLDAGLYVIMRIQTDSGGESCVYTTSMLNLPKLNIYGSENNVSEVSFLSSYNGSAYNGYVRGTYDSGNHNYTMTTSGTQSGFTISYKYKRIGAAY